MAQAYCFKRAVQLVLRAYSLACDNEGSRIAARSASIAITVSSSINVKVCFISFSMYLFFCLFNGAIAVPMAFMEQGTNGRADFAQRQCKGCTMFVLYTLKLTAIVLNYT